MIFVDTSVLIAASRSRAGAEAGILRSLLDADEVALALPVKIEFLSGVAKRDRIAVRLSLSALPLAIPSEETWRQIEAWIGPATDAGYQFTVTDLLIAALAEEMGALVWSLDSDFEAMAKLGLVQLYG